MHDTILFDGEGVVVDSEKLWDLGQEEFLRRRGAVYDRERVKHLLAGRSVLEGVRLLQQEYGFSGYPEALARERIAIVEELFRTQVTFVPGFVEFFHRVPKTIKTCIATMMPAQLLEIVVAKLSLRDLFGDHIYCPDSNALPGKPAPDLFLYAAHELQSSPVRCVVIEDSPVGIEAAKRAGMYCIAIATTFGLSRLTSADMVVSSFEEIALPRIIQA
ncbi:MAG TPA: HAD family phosphatase [Candidatus Sulfotelmatobacter sp.]|nr:HAD family phosphatase [Candidatus Sulfotelmatobacter sp.]